MNAGKISKFRPVKAGTKRAYLLSLLDGTRTIEGVARLCNTTPKNAHVTIYCLRRDYGIGHKIDAEGKIAALLPKNMTLEKAVIEPNARSHARRVRRTSGILAYPQIEKIRRKYRPKLIMTLFVGESPPARGKFFYIGDSLTSRMQRALGLEHLEFEEFLTEFKARCWYLDDLVIGWTADEIDDSERVGLCRAAQDHLASRIRKYHPGAVVSLLRRTEPIVKAACNAAGVDAKFYGVPFPGWGHHRQFIAEMRRILPDLPLCIER